MPAHYTDEELLAAKNKALMAVGLPPIGGLRLLLLRLREALDAQRATAPSAKPARSVPSVELDYL